MNFTEIILRKLQDCPLLKRSGVTALRFAGMDAKTRSMSILNTKGELVIEEYCDGSCDMQYPFALIYRSPEIDTAGKLAAQEPDQQHLKNLYKPEIKAYNIKYED